MVIRRTVGSVNMTNLKKIIFKYCGYFVGGLLLELVLTLLIVEGNTLIGEAIDKMLVGEKVFFSNFFLCFSEMAIASFVIAYVKSFLLTKFSIKVQTDYKKILCCKLYKIDYKFFNDNSTATVINKMNSDILEVDNFLSNTLPKIFINLSETFIYAFSIAYLNFKLLLLVILCYPLLFKFTRYVADRITKLRKDFRKKTDSIAGIVQDSISGILVIKAFGLEAYFLDKLIQAAQDLVDNESKRARTSNNAFVVKNLLQWVPKIICVGYAYILVADKDISIGELLVFILLLERFVKVFVGLPFSLVDAKEHMVCIRRIEEILNYKEEENGKVQIAPNAKVAIAFEDVMFRYDNHTEILKNISFQVPVGGKVALVGESGGGKSTIFKILCGLCTISSGSYKLYGVNYSEWNKDAARGLISLVSQDVFLFPTTIYENVKYGKSEASKEEIIDACKKAGIHEYIMGLHKGYDTVVGERGIMLSGGECQRISIARAFLKGAPILLLDEPTSAIDVDTEQTIQKAINQLSDNRTCLIIAHRLCTIQNADIIIMIKEGEVVEYGSHQELIEKKGYYAQLYGGEMLQEIL